MLSVVRKPYIKNIRMFFAGYSTCRSVGFSCFCFIKVVSINIIISLAVYFDTCFIILHPEQDESFLILEGKESSFILFWLLRGHTGVRATRGYCLLFTQKCLQFFKLISCPCFISWVYKWRNKSRSGIILLKFSSVLLGNTTLTICL